MTTAHRPTWKAAVGQASEGGYGAPSSAESILDVAAHTKLKVRSGHQLIGGKSSEHKADLLRASLRKLQDAEAKLTATRRSRHRLIDTRRDIVPAIEAEGRRKLLTQTADVDDVTLRQKYHDVDADFQNDSDDDRKGGSDADSNNRGEESDLDASDSDLDDDSEDDDNSEDDDEDEEEALQAELVKIRAERALSKAKQETEAAKREKARMEEDALIGNPLLASSSLPSSVSSGKLKRRWNDDVVFRNQAKNEPDRNQKRFINDTVRNDFHKRFLYKFVL